MEDSIVDSALESRYNVVEISDFFSNNLSDSQLSATQSSSRPYFANGSANDVGGGIN